MKAHSESSSSGLLFPGATDVLRQRMMVAEFVARQQTGSPVNGETPTQNHSSSNMPATHGTTNQTSMRLSATSPALSINGSSGNSNGMTTAHGTLMLSQSPLSPRSPGNDGYGSGYDIASLKRKDLFTQRKQREFIPDNKKDDSYWDRRRRNNEAAKRSREKRRYNDMVLEQRVVELTKENHVLKAQLEAIKDKYNICGENLVSVDQIMATLPTSEQVLSITKRAKLTNTVPPTIIYPQSPSPVPTSVIHQSISLDSPTSPLQQTQQQSQSNSQSKSTASLASQQQPNALPHLTPAPHHHFRSCQPSPPQSENGYRENGDGNYSTATGTNSVLHTSPLHNSSNGSTNGHHHLHHHHHHHHPHLNFSSSPSVAAAAAAAVAAQSVAAGASGILTNGTGTGSQSSPTAVAAVALATNICYANGAVSVIGSNATSQLNDISSYDQNNCNGNVLNLSRRGGGASSPYEMSSGTGSGAASGDDEQCDTTPSSLNDINNSLPLKLRHKSHLGDKDAATALLALQHIKQEPSSRASPPWDGEGSSDERDSGISIGTEWTLHQRKIIVPTNDKEENIHLKSQIARLESEVANIKNMMILSTTAGPGATAAAQ